MTWRRRPPEVDPGPYIWAVLFAAGLAYEAREIHRGCDGWPLSRCIRLAFRTDTPTGGQLFTAAVKVGSGLLVWHILNPAQPAQPPREGNHV